MVKRASITRVSVLLALLAITLQCTNITRVVTDAPREKPKDGMSYDSCRKEIASERSKLKQAFMSNKITEDSVAKAYTEMLLNRIIPYWYGTAWDFNGYTSKPGEGTVACGYFVSTTLQHSGMNLNRYRMAQKSAMDGALMIEPKDSLEIDHSSRDAFIADFKRKAEDGLYMVGLSFHVGYLYKSGGMVRFIHSSYLARFA